MPSIENQRRVYEKTKLLLGLVFYPIFLIAIKLNWLYLPENFFLKNFLLASIPLMLILLYLTSYKRIFPGNIGDYIQVSFEISMIVIGSLFFGEQIRISSPFITLLILLIPLYISLLNSTLLFYIAIVTCLLLVIEVLFIGLPEYSFASIIDIVFKVLASIVMAFISSRIIRYIFFEEKSKRDLEKAYQELRKLDEAKSEFISIASHQLRTPLTAIKGYISLINEKVYGTLPEKMEKPIRHIYISSERLIKLVNELLNISRIEAGKIKPELKKSSLERIIDTVITELKSLAKEKNLYLEFKKSKQPLPKILIDKDKIRQVILNVIDNAIRYTDKGGIKVTCKKKENTYQIIVSDTGEGMTKREISDAFKSFTRGRAGRRGWVEGAGLGLYIAKKYMDMHKGKIWAKSPGKNKGSKFYIELLIQ